jgi:uncharacterized protein
MTNQSQPEIPKRSRLWTRRFWIKSSLATLAAGTGLLGWTVLVEPHWVEVCYYDLPLANLPSAWSGRRLVQISDMHIGRVSLDYLQACMQIVNSLEPDLLAITGDFIDFTGGLGEPIEAVLAELKPAKYGSFACLGNHDYGQQWSQSEVADQVIEVISRNGIQVLRDTLVEIQGLNILGVDDYWSPRCNPRQLLRRLDPEACSLALCHNPDACDRFDWSNLHGAILAGHTHGGQCKPPFLPPPILPVQNRLYTSGFFDLNPGRQLFINRGLGHTTPVRFNCRPEISVFKLLAVS